jgi:hypothetical protein
VGVTVGVAEGVRVTVGVGVGEGVGVLLGEKLGVRVEVRDGVLVGEALAVGENAGGGGVGVAVTVGVGYAGEERSRPIARTRYDWGMPSSNQALVASRPSGRNSEAASAGPPSPLSPSLPLPATVVMIPVPACTRRIR